MNYTTWEWLAMTGPAWIWLGGIVLAELIGLIWASLQE